MHGHPSYHSLALRVLLSLSILSIPTSNTFITPTHAQGLGLGAGSLTVNADDVIPTRLLTAPVDAAGEILNTVSLEVASILPSDSRNATTTIQTTPGSTPTLINAGPDDVEDTQDDGGGNNGSSSSTSTLTSTLPAQSTDTLGSGDSSTDGEDGGDTTADSQDGAAFRLATSSSLPSLAATLLVVPLVSHLLRH